MTQILIVEDDKAVADAILFVLNRHYNDVTLHHTRADAEAFLKKTSVDLIITDVWLGDDDGLDFLGAQRQGGNLAPAIVISGGGPGRTLENVTARADAYGAVAVIYKPFEDTELLKAVETALDTPHQ